MPSHLIVFCIATAALQESDVRIIPYASSPYEFWSDEDWEAHEKQRREQGLEIERVPRINELVDHWDRMREQGLIPRDGMLQSADHARRYLDELYRDWNDPQANAQSQGAILGFLGSFHTRDEATRETVVSGLMEYYVAGGAASPHQAVHLAECLYHYAPANAELRELADEILDEAELFAATFGKTSFGNRVHRLRERAKAADVLGAQPNLPGERQSNGEAQPHRGAPAPAMMPPRNAPSAVTLAEFERCIRGVLRSRDVPGDAVAELGDLLRALLAGMSSDNRNRSAAIAELLRCHRLLLHKREGVRPETIEQIDQQLLWLAKNRILAEESRLWRLWGRCLTALGTRASASMCMFIEEAVQQQAPHDIGNTLRLAAAAVRSKE